MNEGCHNLCLSFKKIKNIFSNRIEPYQRHFQLARNSRMSLLQNSRPATYLDIYLACGYEFGLLAVILPEVVCTEFDNNSKLAYQ